MRQAFIQTLLELARQDPRIFLLSADLGFNVLEPFIEEFPERFINVGVAEQNMVGIATGLAEAGFIPWIYSISTFAALRPYEFIRNGPILHQLPVRIVGVGGGFDYESCGITHYGLEDIAVMRAQPGISIVVPANSVQARTAIRATWDLSGPVYYRLGKNDELLTPGLDGAFEVGRLQWIREGRDAAIVVMGSLAVEAHAAVDLLAQAGIDCALAVAASIRPAPLADLQRLVAQVPLVLTAEAHYIDGGLGSLVSEVIAEQGDACKVLRAGVRHMPVGASGKQAYLYETHGLTSRQMASQIQSVLALRSV